MDKKIKIHFMGIGGSACSGVALMSLKQGYSVTGCDLEQNTSYLKKVEESKINIFVGHDINHIKGADYLVVSPAIMFQNPEHPEVLEAQKKGILLTWEEFLGKFLQLNKEVICIAGTHGKSTTTALTSLVFENAKKDPSVILGAKIKEWNTNFRVGNSDLFITEADEFNDNFLNYNPDAIILNNIEFDHPDFFNSYEHVIKSFYNFIKRLRGRKILIINQDSEGIRKLFELMGSDNLDSINIYGYTYSDNPLIAIEKSTNIKINNSDKGLTEFSLQSKNNSIDIYQLSIPGQFNVANATGIIILSKLYGINDLTISETLKNFNGIGRRLDLIGEKNGIKVYDDYAHHPTAIKATISALRQIFPVQKIWVIVEPHSYSRTKALLSAYKGVFEDADKVIIGPIFKARDKDTFGVNSSDIVKVSSHKNIEFIKDIETIVKKTSMDAKNGDVILVMGAGKSYIWARKILSHL